MSEVREGDRVKVHYTGRFPDGQVFDTSDGGEPLEFTAGGSEVIPGFAKAVVGMTTGEKKTVSIAAADGYGEHDPRLLQKVPMSSLPDGAKVGDQLQASGGGQNFFVWIRGVEGDEAQVDGNHPLAGKDLEFDLEIVEIQAA